MSDSFVGKWRARWPEWQIAEAFLPVSIRAQSLAWFALRQELLDAAWAGADARPGEAKLGWWAEELQGWSLGRRRHPLGVTLQATSAPWLNLAAALPTLAAARERATDLPEAQASLLPFAAAVADVDAALAGDGLAPTAAAVVAIHLLGQRAVFADANAVPLAMLARLGAQTGTDSTQATRDWAGELLQAWPPEQGTRATRIHAAFLRERLRQLATGRAAAQHSRWRSLVTAWRAARGRHSVPRP